MWTNAFEYDYQHDDTKLIFYLHLFLRHCCWFIIIFWYSAMLNHPHLKYLDQSLRMSIHKQKMKFITELLYIPQCAWGRSLSDPSVNWTYSWDFANLSFWSALDKPGHAWLHVTEKPELIHYFHGYPTTFINLTSCLNFFLRYCWFIILRYLGHAQPCQTT